ncbi:metal-dependent hydrolase family protein [Govanella unica]|uniref:Amidohydrolase family protein n=1 Tax=Govanella unica TaxID=2975056 RepID=A0A9X3TY55_9PROT|nr:amidohydrolase family protein [Govania unica]MDA5194151.1 amidohydrolase family protein [Govania unica]
MPRTLITNGLIFDGHSPDLIADHYVLIENGRIARVRSGKPDVAADRVLDLKGKVLMPGLIDAHFHAYAAEANMGLLEELPISYLAQRARPLMEGALKRGFTTVRDAGGADYGLWRAIEEGHFDAPRLFYAGRAFSQAGGHGDSRASHIEPCGCGMRGNLAEVVDGVDDLRKAVREALRQGAHQIKIFVSGGISSPTDPIWMLQYSEEEIRAVVDEATRRRSYVMAHAYTAETILRGVRCGIRSIEHANLIDAEAAAAVAEHGAFVVPTLITYAAIARHGKALGVPQITLDKLSDVKDQGLTAIELCRKAGVKLGFGTDLLGDMHKHQLDEFEIRAEVETPFQILNSATAVNAALVQQPDLLGCVREGAHADLLVIDGNPLQDVRIMARPERMALVMRGGKIIVNHLP